MHLRKWKNMLREALYDSYDTDMDTDHPECPRCGSTMEFHGHDDEGDFPYGEGYWKCESCGFKITENDL